jgi:hypothetical protein
MPTQIDPFRVPSLLPPPTFSRPNLPTGLRRLGELSFFLSLELGTQSNPTARVCTLITKTPYGCSTAYNQVGTGPYILSEAFQKPILPCR